MINLRNGNITDILPTMFKSSPEVQSIGYAIQKAISLVMDDMGQAMIYAGIDSLPGNILDVLAAEFDVPYWDTNFTIDKKRGLIKGAFSVISKIGTPSSIKTLVQMFFEEADVEEWWKYGAQPFHFKVNIELDEDATTEEQTLAMNLVTAYKNVRSVIDEINFYQAGAEAPSYFTTANIGQAVTDSGTAFNY